MRKLTVTILESIEDIDRLDRGDVVPAKIGQQIGPEYMAVARRPSKGRIELLRANGGTSVTGFAFNYKDGGVNIGGLGGVKKGDGEDVERVHYTNNVEIVRTVREARLKERLI